MLAGFGKCLHLSCILFLKHILCLCLLEFFVSFVCLFVFFFSGLNVYANMPKLLFTPVCAQRRGGRVHLDPTIFEYFPVEVSL